MAKTKTVLDLEAVRDARRPLERSPKEHAELTSERCEKEPRRGPDTRKRRHGQRDAVYLPTPGELSEGLVAYGGRPSRETGIRVGRREADYQEVRVALSLRLAYMSVTAATAQQAALLGPISPAEITDCYRHAAVVELDLCWFDLTDASNAVIGIGWSVELRDADGKLTRGDIQRYLWVTKPFRGKGGDGRVAENVYFCLETRAQGRGIFTQASEREFELYRRWGCQEVHLTSGCDARRSDLWLRRGFEVPVEDWGALEVHYDILRRTHPGWPVELTSKWSGWPNEFKDHYRQRFEDPPLYKALGDDDERNNP